MEVWELCLTAHWPGTTVFLRKSTQLPLVTLLGDFSFVTFCGAKSNQKPCGPDPSFKLVDFCRRTLFLVQFDFLSLNLAKIWRIYPALQPGPSLKMPTGHFFNDSSFHKLAKFSCLVFVSKNRLYQRPLDHELALEIVLDLVAALFGVQTQTTTQNNTTLIKE